MSKRHFLLYDFVLPLLGILAAGTFLSQQFDTAVFRWLDSLKAFGLGSWFSHSPLRETLWAYSQLLFAAPAALLWLAWMRINLEYDYVERGRKLDRPIFKLVRGLLRWIEGTDAGAWQAQNATFRLAQSEDRARRLEAELMKTRQAYADLEADYAALEEETSTLDEMEDFRDIPEAERVSAVAVAAAPAATAYPPPGYRSEPAPVQPTISAERLRRLADL
jgi:hypothetical protein